MADELDYLAALSPIERMRLGLELQGANRTPEEMAAARRQNAIEALGMMPVIGNAMSAADVPGNALDAAMAALSGRPLAAAGNAGLAALNAFGAVSGLPTGRMAGEAAREGGRTLNIFAGPTAKTADKAALARAEEMTGAGASRDDIWRDTGWFQGVDGKWRFEIDDSPSRLGEVKPMVDRGVTEFTGLHHPDLENAYSYQPVPIGFYGPGTEMRGGIKDDYVFAQGANSEDARSVALHEMQHAIQEREGFSGGSSQGYHFVKGPELDAAEKTAMQRLDKMASRVPGGSPEYAQIMNDKERILSEAAYRDYWRTAGEVEARNVMTRMDMSPAQRRATPPWMTQDTPDDQQLFDKAVKSLMGR
jgi:hypothetical protein